MGSSREWSQTGSAYELTNTYSDFVIAKITHSGGAYAAHVWSNKENEMQLVKEGIKTMFEAKQIVLDSLG